MEEVRVGVRLIDDRLQGDRLRIGANGDVQFFMKRHHFSVDTFPSVSVAIVVGS